VDEPYTYEKARLAWLLGGLGCCLLLSGFVSGWLSELWALEAMA